MSLLTQKEFNYSFDANECSKCQGNCCIGASGYIWINKQEIYNLSEHLNMPYEDFGMKYLKKVGYKYSLCEKQVSEDNYACIFFDLEKKQCSVYEARPSQCRTFPFWEQFKNNEQEVYEECPAVKPL